MQRSNLRDIGGRSQQKRFFAAVEDGPDVTGLRRNRGETCLGLTHKGPVFVQELVSTMTIGEDHDNLSPVITQILGARDSSLIIASDDDLLFDMTSGARNRLGPVIHLKWNARDGAPKNRGPWASWNPLSPKWLRPAGSIRDRQIERVARQLSASPGTTDHVLLEAYIHVVVGLVAASRSSGFRSGLNEDFPEHWRWMEPSLPMVHDFVLSTSGAFGNVLSLCRRLQAFGSARLDGNGGLRPNANEDEIEETTEETTEEDTDGKGPEDSSAAMTLTQERDASARGMDQVNPFDRPLALLNQIAGMKSLDRARLLGLMRETLRIFGQPGVRQRTCCAHFGPDVLRGLPTAEAIRRERGIIGDLKPIGIDYRPIYTRDDLLPVTLYLSGSHASGSDGSGAEDPGLAMEQLASHAQDKDAGSSTVQGSVYSRAASLKRLTALFLDVAFAELLNDGQGSSLDGRPVTGIVTGADSLPRIEAAFRVPQLGWSSDIALNLHLRDIRRFAAGYETCEFSALVSGVGAVCISGAIAPEAGSMVSRLFLGSMGAQFPRVGSNQGIFLRTGDFLPVLAEMSPYTNFAALRKHVWSRLRNEGKPPVAVLPGFLIS